MAQRPVTKMKRISLPPAHCDFGLCTITTKKQIHKQKKPCSQICFRFSKTLNIQSLTIEKEEPPMRMLFISAPSSATAVYQVLGDNGGTGLMFETEGDTLP